MNEQREANNRERFTVRVNEDTGIMIRHSYELNRNRRVIGGQKAMSLNEFLVSLITVGLDREAIDQKDSEALYASLVMEEQEEAM
jgi:hypothetical protein